MAWEGRSRETSPYPDRAVVLCDTTPFGSHLECLTVNRWPGQGWRMGGSGTKSSATFVSPKARRWVYDF